MTNPRKLLVAATAAVTAALAPITAYNLIRGEDQSSPAVVTHDRQAAAAEKRSAEATGALKLLIDAQQNERVLRFTLAYNAHQAELWYAEIARQEAERAQAARSAPVRRTPSSGSSRGVEGGGGSCGGATNGADAFIARESGGNPNARNPSGAWGCYQIMPGTWSSSCSDLGAHGSASTEAQAACASRLPRSAWSASGPTG